MSLGKINNPKPFGGPPQLWEPDGWTFTMMSDGDLPRWEPPDGPPMEGFAWTCTAPTTPHGPAPTTWIPCLHRGRCIQIPKAWCGLPVHPGLPQYIVKCFDNYQECIEDDCCKKIEPLPPHESPPVDPDDPTITTDICIETRARKSLNINCEVWISRSPSLDVGTAENPDPATPNGKAFVVKIKFEEIEWEKESLRECVSLANFAHQDFDQIRRPSAGLGILAYPILGYDMEFDADHIRQWGYFMDRMARHIGIGYFVQFEISAEPTNCNIPCIVGAPSWSNPEGASWACGGRKTTIDATDYAVGPTGNEPKVLILADWESDGYNIAQSLGLLSGGMGPYIAPPGWITDEDEPSLFQTYKDSFLLYALFNLLPPTHRNDLMPSVPPEVVRGLRYIRPVDYCVPEVELTSADLGPMGNNLPTDNYFTSPDLNSIFKAFNSLAPEQ